MWDPSILWHDGKYYAFMMYSKETANGLDAGHCLLAVSGDGVHWRTEGVVLEELDLARGCKFFKCMVARCGDRFIMDHGVMRPEGQDMLRFYESRDLKDWSYLFSSRPDPRWYALPPGLNRWDHMYILPKEEGNHSAGYWGYPVALVKPGDPRGIAMMQSPDGLEWEVLPPAKVEWGDLPPFGIILEWGGCERIDGKYYLIGGGDYLGFTGYGMFVFVADHPRGPFRPTADTTRLCGSSDTTVSWLAGWSRGNGELLISNSASMVAGTVGAPSLLPLRKPILDGNGSLRLGWWKGNEALKGKPLGPIETALTLDAANGYAVTYLQKSFRPERGLVVEGTLRARPSAANAAAGFALDEGDGKALATLLGVGAPQGRETHIGRLDVAAGTFNILDRTGKHCATVTGIAPGREHSFRLLSRLSLFELYIDDRLMQTFVYEPAAGRIGFVARHAYLQVAGLKAWEMSL